MRARCDACAELLVYLVGIEDECTGEAAALIGACAAHVAAAIDHAVVLIVTSDVDDLVLVVTRSLLAGDPPTDGPFSRIELSLPDPPATVIAKECYL